MSEAGTSDSSSSHVQMYRCKACDDDELYTAEEKEIHRMQKHPKKSVARKSQAGRVSTGAASEAATSIFEQAKEEATKKRPRGPSNKSKASSKKRKIRPEHAYSKKNEKELAEEVKRSKAYWKG